MLSLYDAIFHLIYYKNFQFDLPSTKIILRDHLSEAKSKMRLQILFGFKCIIQQLILIDITEQIDLIFEKRLHHTLLTTH